ncbi:MAG: hypothetical protein MUF54_16915, partial [Polyangiaceae bacterium]|nr:hypothetical protein [Polyangiaceae bacterium]
MTRACFERKGPLAIAASAWGQQYELLERASRTQADVNPEAPLHEPTHPASGPTTDRSAPAHRAFRHP